MRHTPGPVQFLSVYIIHDSDHRHVADAGEVVPHCISEVPSVCF